LIDRYPAERGAKRATEEALALGADLRFVVDWLGHADIQNSIIYAFSTVARANRWRTSI